MWAERAVAYQIAAHPRCRLIAPREDHGSRVSALCRATGATGTFVADAQNAALAMSAGCTWVTRDRDFQRFEPHGLRWHHLVG